MATIRQITERVEQAIAKHQIDLPWYERDGESYDVYGLRFEEVERQVGDVCPNSRHNPDREDERDFPVYGSPEYDELPELDGASTWHISESGDSHWQRSYVSWGQTAESEREYTFCSHCYIVAGERGNHDDPDDNEILIRNAKVIEVIF